MATLMRRTVTRTWAPIFNELQADGAALGLGELGVGQAEAAQRVDQHVGHDENHSRSWLARIVAVLGAVGEQLELLFLDAVLHLATRAVELLVEVPAAHLRRSAR